MFFRRARKLVRLLWHRTRSLKQSLKRPVNTNWSKTKKGFNISGTSVSVYAKDEPDTNAHHAIRRRNRKSETEVNSCTIHTANRFDGFVENDILSKERLFWLHFCDGMSFIQEAYFLEHGESPTACCATENTCNAIEFTPNLQSGVRNDGSYNQGVGPFPEPIESYGIRISRTDEQPQLRPMPSEHSFVGRPETNAYPVNLPQNTAYVAQFSLDENKKSVSDHHSFARLVHQVQKPDGSFTEGKYSDVLHTPPIVMHSTPNREIISTPSSHGTASQRHHSDALTRGESPFPNHSVSLQSYPHQSNQLQKIFEHSTNGTSHTIQLVHTITLTCLPTNELQTKRTGTCDGKSCCLDNKPSHAGSTAPTNPIVKRLAEAHIHPESKTFHAVYELKSTEGPDEHYCYADETLLNVQATRTHTPPDSFADRQLTRKYSAWSDSQFRSTYKEDVVRDQRTSNLCPLFLGRRSSKDTYQNADQSGVCCVAVDCQGKCDPGQTSEYVARSGSSQRSSTEPTENPSVVVVPEDSSKDQTGCCACQRSKPRAASVRYEEDNTAVENPEQTASEQASDEDVACCGRSKRRTERPSLQPVEDIEYAPTRSTDQSEPSISERPSLKNDSTYLPEVAIESTSYRQSRTEQPSATLEEKVTNADNYDDIAEADEAEGPCYFCFKKRRKQRVDGDLPAQIDRSEEPAMERLDSRLSESTLPPTAPTYDQQAVRLSGSHEKCPCSTTVVCMDPDEISQNDQQPMFLNGRPAAETYVSTTDETKRVDFSSHGRREMIRTFSSENEQKTETGRSIRVVRFDCTLDPSQACCAFDEKRSTPWTTQVNHVLLDNTRITNAEAMSNTQNYLSEYNVTEGQTFINDVPMWSTTLEPVECRKESTLVGPSSSKSSIRDQYIDQQDLYEDFAGLSSTPLPECTQQESGLREFRYTDEYKESRSNDYRLFDYSQKLNQSIVTVPTLPVNQVATDRTSEPYFDPTESRCGCSWCCSGSRLGSLHLAHDASGSHTRPQCRIHRHDQTCPVHPCPYHCMRHNRIYPTFPGDTYITPGHSCGSYRSYPTRKWRCPLSVRY